MSRKTLLKALKMILCVWKDGSGRLSGNFMLKNLETVKVHMGPPLTSVLMEV